MADESPLDNLDMETTIARVRRMLARETHPTWVHAAYADLAQRLEALSADVAALHTQLDEIRRLIRHDDNGRNA